MRAYYCDHFVLPLPAGHRFPMEKYRILRERLAGDHELALPFDPTEAEPVPVFVFDQSLPHEDDD